MCFTTSNGRFLHHFALTFLHFVEESWSKTFGGKPPNSTRVETLRAPKVLKVEVLWTSDPLRGSLTGTSLLVDEFVTILSPLNGQQNDIFIGM